MKGTLVPWEKAKGAKAPGKCRGCQLPLAEANGNLNPLESNPEELEVSLLISSSYRQLQLTVQKAPSLLNGTLVPGRKAKGG